MFDDSNDCFMLKFYTKMLNVYIEHLVNEKFVTWYVKVIEIRIFYHTVMQPKSNVFSLAAIC